MPERMNRSGSQPWSACASYSAVVMALALVASGCTGRGVEARGGAGPVAPAARSLPPMVDDVRAKVQELATGEGSALRRLDDVRAEIVRLVEAGDCDAIRTPLASVDRERLFVLAFTLPDPVLGELLADQLGAIDELAVTCPDGGSAREAAQDDVEGIASLLARRFEDAEVIW